MESCYFTYRLEIDSAFYFSEMEDLKSVYISKFNKIYPHYSYFFFFYFWSAEDWTLSLSMLVLYHWAMSQPLAIIIISSILAQSNHLILLISYLRSREVKTI